MASNPRHFLTGVVLILSSLLAACGGGGGAVPSASGQSIVSVNGNNIDFTGKIDQLLPSGFHMEVGTGAGYNTVKTTASTVFVGAKPFVGEQVEVIGTGSFAVANSIVATQVKQLGVSPSPSASPSPSPTGTPGPTPTPGLQGVGSQSTAIVPPSGVSYYSGRIVQMYNTGFSFYAGTNYGNMHEVSQSFTKWVGPAPSVGQYAYITGPSQPGYWVNGSLVTVTSSPQASATVAGTIAAATPYGFTLTTAQGQTVPVGLTGSTVIGGGPMYEGSTVTVNGIGSAATSVVAVQIVVAAPTPAPNSSPTPTPGPISTLHVPTADYLAGLYGTTTVTAAQAAPYLSWAQTDYHSANSISSAGIQTQLYSDPNREASTDPMWQYSFATESDFAHDCNGNRIVFNDTAGRYVMDPTSATLQQHFAQMVATQMSRGHFDIVWEDNAGPLTPDQAFASFTPSLPCNYSDAEWIQGGLALNNAPALPVMVNGLNIPNGHAVSETMHSLHRPTRWAETLRAVIPMSISPNRATGSGRSLRTRIQTVAQGKIFECMLRNQGAAASNADARLYGYASYLLTYDPSKTIFWEEFQTPSGFHVEPESQLVVSNPVVPTPADISGLQVGTSVYGREYQDCYIAGQFVSACAVVVNADGYNPHVFPYPQYTHSLVLSGGGILDGGTMSTNGPPPPQNLAPAEAEIVFP